MSKAFSFFNVDNRQVIRSRRKAASSPGLKIVLRERFTRIIGQLSYKASHFIINWNDTTVGGTIFNFFVRLRSLVKRVKSLRPPSRLKVFMLSVSPVLPMLALSSGLFIILWLSFIGTFILMMIVGITSIVVVSSIRATLSTTKALSLPCNDNTKAMSTQNMNAIKLETVEEGYGIAPSPEFMTESLEFTINS